MNPKRVVASALAFAAGVCSGLSTISPWWSISVALPSEGATLKFLPGDAFSVSGNFYGNSAQGSLTYASHGLGQVGALYEGVLAFGVVVMVLSIAAGGIGLIWAFGKGRGPSKGSAFRSLTLALTIISVAAALLVPLAQPGIIAQHPAGLCGSSGGVKTMCNSFWGSASANGATATWGADVGWYLWVASFVLLITAMVVWQLSRDEPWETPIVTPGVPVATYGGPASETSIGLQGQPSADQAESPPVITNGAPQTAPAAERFCPACGGANLRSSQFCESCGKPLPSRP